MPESSVNQTGTTNFGDLVRKFADDVALNFSQHVPAQPEDQLKAHVGQLLSSVGELNSLNPNPPKG